MNYESKYNDEEEQKGQGISSYSMEENTEKERREKINHGEKSDEESSHSDEILSNSDGKSEYSNDRRAKMRRGNGGGRGGSRISERSHKGKGFRLQGKMFSITYPKCEATREEFDTNFRIKFPVLKEYQSAREDHKDGSKHMHVFVHFESEVRIV